MRSVTLVVLLVAASACSDSDSTNPSSGHSGGAASSQPEQVRTSPEALVYAAVIRRLVTTDTGSGAASSARRRVYVLSGAAPGAADPMRVISRPVTPFDDRLQRAITAALNGRPSVAFVKSRGAAVTEPAPGHVVHRGVLITLGPIKWLDPGSARVSNNRWSAGLDGQWLTYTVERDDSGWNVTGTVGPVSIS